MNFGGNRGDDFLVQNDNVVTATAPAGNLGAVDVKVTTAGGTTATSAADKFTYIVPPVPTVTGVSPASGPSTGGTTVTITGTGFAGASAVNFGAGNPAIFFTVNSPTSMTRHRADRPARARRRDGHHPRRHERRHRRRQVHLHRAAAAGGHAA